MVHYKLNLNLVYALSTRSLCQTKITQDAITTRAYRRVEVKFLAILLDVGYWSNEAFKCYCGYFFIHSELSPFYGIIRDDVRVLLLEFSFFFFSIYAKRLRCMRIDQDLVGETTSMYANQLVCETTGFRRIMQILTRYSVKTYRNLALSCIHLSYSTSKFLYLFWS